MALDHATEALQRLIHHHQGIFSIQSLADLRRTDDIRKEDGDEPELGDFSPCWASSRASFSRIETRAASTTASPTIARACIQSSHRQLELAALFNLILRR